MIKILGPRLLVKPVEVADRDAEHMGKVAPTLLQAGLKVARSSDVEAAERHATQVGTVEQIGEQAWMIAALGNKPWCQVGDRIVFGKYTGKLIKDPESEQEYFILNDEDVMAVLKG